MTLTDPHTQYREQHKKRLSYMPWLYWTLKPKHREWAEAWQAEVQSHFMAMETVIFEGDCFIAPDAQLFAEPGRPIIIGNKSFIGSQAVLHGPITIGENVGVNHHVAMEGGRESIRIGNHCRIAAYCHLYAFNHGMASTPLIREQPVNSQGITLGQDVWLGTHVGITDGVNIGDGCVIGMQSVVTRSIPAGKVAAGNPARIIRDR